MDKIISWLALINSKGIGPVKFWKLLDQFGGIEEAIRELGLEVDYRRAEKIYKKYCCNIIMEYDLCYPANLRRLDNRPPILFFRGDKNVLLQDAIGIIGARNSSINGNSIAYNMAKNLSDYYAIVSGMARGIDSSVHRGSLNHNKKTITVLPLGIENIYPNENKNLCEEIENNGVVISEYIAYPNNNQGAFHARNRIICGMCKALIVVEAANKSGTIQSANLALDIGCDVFVVPGSPLDARSHGGNGLIKNGAPLVENYLDVLDLLDVRCNDRQDHNINTGSNICTTNKTNSSDSINQKEEKILSLLDANPISMEVLSLRANLSINDLLYVISVLEIKGKIVKHNMNMISIRS